MLNILVTGANRGIGLELVRQCLERGNRLFAGCRSPEEAGELRTLAAESPDRLTILRLAVTSETSLIQARAIVEAEAGRLDVLFNNAAVNSGDETILEVSAPVLMESLQINAIAPVLVVKLFLSLLKQGRSPKVINISSEAGSISRMRHFRGYAYYGSKAALNMYTRSLSMDPEMEGILVVALHPGWVRTDMGGPSASLSAEESVRGLMKVFERLTFADQGKFLTYAGEEYPW